MARRGLIQQLPQTHFEALVRRIVRSDGSGYRELATWCHRRGFPMSSSTVHSFGAAHGAELRLLQRARFIRAAARGRVTMRAALQICAITDLSEALTILSARIARR